MNLVYVFAASKMEVQPLWKVAGLAAAPGSGVSSLRCGPNEVVPIIGGMGPKRARASAERTLGLAPAGYDDSKPEAVLIIGVCGGLTACLPEGRVVAYTACLSTEAAHPPLRCSPNLTDSIIVMLGSSNITCDCVVGVTSPRIATTRDERLALAKHGASVVDMESYSILTVAAAADIPAGVLRVVSDSLDRGLPDFNRALNADGAFDQRKAFKVALRSPLRTIRLVKANRRALQNLTRALEIVLPSDCFAKAIASR